MITGLFPPATGRIDRHALVTRHNVELTAYDGERPLQVGNGEFAFGMDVTGLQTFAPFNTMSQWGWHRSPLPAGERIENYHLQPYPTHGREVLYPLPDPKHPELSDWLTGNQHRLNLGRVGLVLTKADGMEATASDLRDIHQKLDLWHGVVTSRFTVEGQPVTVTTACHPKKDQIAARVESPLIRSGRLKLFVDAPGDDPRQFANFVGDWADSPGLQRLGGGANRADFVRRLPGDGDDTYVSLAWAGTARLQAPDTSVPLEIVKAEYGAEGAWADVTTVAQKAVHDGHLSLRASNELFGDPAEKRVKRLRVVYRIAGSQATVEANENEVVSIGVGHRYTLVPSANGETLSFVCAFSPKPLPKRLPNADETVASAEKVWPTYWESGGAIDLSGSRDPRWHELERRIVLSQYLMKVNESGSNPPQESGLVNNGWFGRFHLEMVWWHMTHWALWNRPNDIERTRRFYLRILPQAKVLAQVQGYRGARWPKCIGPNGMEWPFFNHAYLVWQQPNPIFFAELDYRAHPTPETLKKWQPIVEATGDFLASYAVRDEATKRNVLGPPMMVVSENTPFATTTNSTFELGYWRFGLRVATEWAKRMGKAPHPAWTETLNGLAPLPTQDGLYVLYEGVPDMWTKYNFEHPALTGVYGMLPGDGVDVPTMRRTLDKVSSVWNFDHTWGWDFPMLAMCAARLGEPQRAVDFLLHPSGGFQFDERGLATGGPFPYFPSNGALLYGVAMMAAGWDGAPKVNAPGFPQDGSWTVRWEGLSPAP